MTALKTTELKQFPGGPVIVTEGMIDGSTGERIYGVFADEVDARSIDADSLALGTVGADKLTAEQLADAAENSELL